MRAFSSHVAFDNLGKNSIFFLFLIIIELGWVLFAVSGAVCASLLARNGVSVTLFESARGPGGRMSYRK